MAENLKNYNSIDIAKFVMAILVMTIHISTGLPAEIHSFISNGLARIAVPFFFLASGFFFFRKKENLEFKNLLKTLKRIFLLFLGWTIIYGMYFFFKEYIHLENSFRKELSFLFRHIFLNPYGHLWFLPALMIGIGMGWFFLKFNLKKTGILIGILLYCIGVLGDSYYYLAIKNEYIKIFFDWYLQHFTNFRNGFFFGFVFVMLHDTFKNVSKSNLIILSSISLIVIYTEYFYVKNNHYASDYNMYFSLLVFTPAFFHLLAKTPVQLSKNTALFFREYSMGIYFLHILIKDLDFMDYGLFRFPMILVECMIVIFIIKKLKIPVLSFLLK